MRIPSTPADIAAPAAAPGCSIADDGAFVTSLVAADIGRPAQSVAGSPPAPPAPDPAQDPDPEAGADGADLDLGTTSAAEPTDAAALGAVVAAFPSRADIPGHQFGAAGSGRVRAAAAAAVAIARISELRDGHQIATPVTPSTPAPPAATDAGPVAKGLLGLAGDTTTAATTGIDTAIATASGAAPTVGQVGALPEADLDDRPIAGSAPTSAATIDISTSNTTAETTATSIATGTTGTTGTTADEVPATLPVGDTAVASVTEAAPQTAVPLDETSTTTQTAPAPTPVREDTDARPAVPAPTEAPVAAEAAPADVAASEVTTPPVLASAAAEQPASRGSGLATTIAARVEAALEALRNAPPPREATIEVEGMRLLVRLRGDVVQVVPDQPIAPQAARDLGAALADRGLQLGDGTAHDRGASSQDHQTTHDGNDHAAGQPAAPSATADERHVPATADSVLL